MNRLPFLAVSLLPLVSCAALAQIPNPAPVPPAIQAAKAIFISNAGADSGLFPSPFTGDPSRGYTEFYTALQRSGQYQLVSDPSQADLVLELKLTAPYGPSNPNKAEGASDPRPMFTLTVYDRSTHYVLWTLTQSINLAILQKTHDRNFDDALNGIVSQFELLSRKQPAATP